MSKEEKRVLPARGFTKKIVPIEYEAQGIFLKDLLNADFVKKLTDNLGDFDVANITLIVEEGDEVIMMWHKGSEDVKEGVVTITCRNPEVKNALAKALGLEV